MVEGPLSPEQMFSADLGATKALFAGLVIVITQDMAAPARASFLAAIEHAALRSVGAGTFGTRRPDGQDAARDAAEMKVMEVMAALRNPRRD